MYVFQPSYFHESDSWKGRNASFYNGGGHRYEGSALSAVLRADNFMRIWLFYQWNGQIFTLLLILMKAKSETVRGGPLLWEVWSFPELFSTLCTVYRKRPTASKMSWKSIRWFNKSRTSRCSSAETCLAWGILVADRKKQEKKNVRSEHGRSSALLFAIESVQRKSNE